MRSDGRSPSSRDANILSVLIAGALACSLGCGGGQAKGDAGTVADGTGDFLPLAVGNNWTYQLTDTDGKVSSSVVSVTAKEAAGGSGPNAAMTAFRVVTGNMVDDENGDVSWQAIVDGRVLRLREASIDGKTGRLKNEQTWDPPRLRLDESDAHTAAEASWVEPVYTEYDTDWDSDGDGGVVVPDGGATTKPNIKDLWSVVSPGEAVTVPAGTFKALILRRVGDSGATVKNYWFARGVGLVKQTEDGSSTHELVSYRTSP
jgi:hypothetical protein